MDDIRGRNCIQSLQKKWQLQVLLAYLISAIAITIFASAIAFKLMNANWVVVPAVLITAMIIVYLLLEKKIDEQDVTKFLNEGFPELQESSHLVLKPYESLNALEKLQVKKVENRLNENFPSPPAVKKKIRASSIMLVAALIFSIILYIIPFKTISHAKLTDQSSGIEGSDRPEIKLPQVEDASIKITPPSYTGKSAKEQDRFNLVAEQDAEVNWTISTTVKANDLLLIFNDKSVLHLQSLNKEHTKWAGRKVVKSPGFYQVKIGNNLSELYKIEVIKDQFPVITVQSPKPNTVIEYGQSQKILLTFSLTDDYGIESTFINATTASGSGEAVKFKEQQLAISNFGAGAKRYQLQKQIDLAALGMQPGDELYFYIDAKDNYHQEKKSDVFIVRIEDTAQLMSMDGLVSGVDMKPEFFRSERQIIIETEQLIKDRDTISVKNFNKKSNDLGVDQKLLRLRYGKFLGEESENEIGEGHHDNEAGDNDAADFGNADKIMDQFSHKHDQAEDATFFDAATKKQLLATLSEMWKAELQLRTYKPKDALPFEYKALRLLKDLQQKTRAYVSKTGATTTPLKPEKRLTGDLTAIAQPVNQQDFKKNVDPTVTLRKAVGVLEQVRNKEELQRPAVEILQQASIQLSAKAASEPSIYLAPFEALRRILKNNFKPRDIDLAGSALQRMIKSVSNNPQQSKTSPDMKLSQRYYLNLNRKND